jgi:hypothetical protein
MKRSKSGKLQHEDVTVVMWHNNLEILLSTNTDPKNDDNVLKKWQREREVEIPCPKAVVNYTQNMWCH